VFQDSGEFLVCLNNFIVFPERRWALYRIFPGNVLSGTLIRDL